MANKRHQSQTLPKTRRELFFFPNRRPRLRLRPPPPCSASGHIRRDPPPPPPCSGLRLSLSRSMGGGRRKFPGGLSKWQWKRLHEKKAREKERKLLDHERQLYQARPRSQIRAKMLGVDDGAPPPQEEQSGAAMTRHEHVKALADRFMKPGAEDLWNDDDGPLTEPEHRRPAPVIYWRRRRLLSDIDLRGLVPRRSRLGANLGSIGSTELGGRKIYHSHSQSGESSNLGLLLSSVENGLVLLKGHRCYALEAGRGARAKNRFRM